MGSYTEAIEAFREGHDPVPNIEAHRQQGRTKYGLGANIEYSFPAGVRLFARSGWNSGDTESFAYTEVNDTAAVLNRFDDTPPGSCWDRLSLKSIPISRMTSTTSG